MNETEVVEIVQPNDITKVIDQTLLFAGKAGLDQTRKYMVATSVSELATNIIRFAGKGRIICRKIEIEMKKGVEIIAEDDGPGISNLETVMQDGYSTLKDSLGLGLSGVKRLMDEFKIETTAHMGTQISAIKWI